MGHTGARDPNPQLHSGQPSRLSRGVVVGGFRYTLFDRLANLVCGVAFWVLLVVDIFAGCYWVGSQVALRLITIGWVRAGGVRYFAITFGTLMTAFFLIGFMRWLLLRRNPGKPK